MWKVKINQIMFVNNEIHLLFFITFRIFWKRVTGFPWQKINKRQHLMLQLKAVQLEYYSIVLIKLQKYNIKERQLVHRVPWVLGKIELLWTICDIFLDNMVFSEAMSCFQKKIGNSKEI